MRRLVFGFAVIVAALVAVMPGVSSAANVGGEVFGAWNTHGMNDVNDALDAANQAGSDFSKVENGLTGGIAVRVWPTGSWMFSAAWEPLFLQTEDAASSTTFNVDANSFQATAAYFFPSLMPAKYGIGGGVAMYSLAGETSSPSTPTTKMEGSGVGFHMMALSEITVSPGFAVTAGAGWRWADITIDQTSPEQTADYSGFMGRLGLAFYLPTP